MSNFVHILRKKGFLFPSSEIYGGFRGGFDLGPYAVAMKNKISSLWIDSVVRKNREIVLFESPIITPTPVLKASGHLTRFHDEVVQDLLCDLPLRFDKCTKLKTQNNIIPIIAKNNSEAMEWKQKLESIIPNVKATIKDSVLNVEFDKINDKITIANKTFQNMANPINNSPFLGPKKQMNLLYEVGDGFLRPETAQGVYTSLPNLSMALGLRVPFGVAQIGTSFRRELKPEHLLFRTREFQQMEMQYFVDENEKVFDLWVERRYSWHKSLLKNVRVRSHSKEELAHYASECADIEYLFPWGWGEIEGIANRTDYDLSKHQRESGKSMKLNENKVPYCVETSCGLSRTLLAILFDGFIEQKSSYLLQVHPLVAPFQVSVLPIVRNNKLILDCSYQIYQNLIKNGIDTHIDEFESIGRRYVKSGELGIPICITIDNESINEKTVTFRYRDTKIQERVSVEFIVSRMQQLITEWRKDFIKG